MANLLNLVRSAAGRTPSVAPGSVRRMSVRKHLQGLRRSVVATETQPRAEAAAARTPLTAMDVGTVAPSSAAYSARPENRKTALESKVTRRCFASSTSASTGTDDAAKNDAGAAGLDRSYDNILVDGPSDRQPGVAVVTLNRPKAMNALNDALFADLLHAVQALNDNDAVGCIVITGSRKAFAAGADIAEMSQRTYEDVARRDMFAEWQTLVTTCGARKPIIAAVSGYCLGGGCELAMMCDIMVCGESAKFGQPEINLGIIPGAGGTQRLTRAVGKSKAMLWTLTGDFWSADEACNSGLAAKVFPDDQLLTETIKIASKIAGKGRISVQACKEAVNASEELPLAEGLRLERRLFHGLFATDDQKEGMAAFLEKRNAQFKR